jgi:hypothetical protein
MKNFFATLITFFIELFTKSPVPVETSPAAEAAPVLDNPEAFAPEEVEAILVELDDENPDTPDTPEVVPDTPEVEDVYEDLDDDTETTLEELLEIGGGVEFE